MPCIHTHFQVLFVKHVMSLLLSVVYILGAAFHPHVFASSFCHRSNSEMKYILSNWRFGTSDIKIVKITKKNMTMFWVIWNEEIGGLLMGCIVILGKLERDGYICLSHFYLCMACIGWKIFRMWLTALLKCKYLLYISGTPLLLC